MFGRRRTRESSSPRDFLAKILIVLAVIAIILILAAFVSWYILIGFLAVGVMIGLFYAIRSFVRGCITAKRSLSSYASTRVGKFSIIFDKLLYFNVEAAKNAFAENKAVATNAFTKSKSLRILSFKKWMWFIVALSVMVFGCIIIALVVILQFILLGIMILPISLVVVIKHCVERRS